MSKWKFFNKRSKSAKKRENDRVDYQMGYFSGLDDGKTGLYSNITKREASFNRWNKGYYDGYKRGKRKK